MYTGISLFLGGKYGILWRYGVLRTHLVSFQSVFSAFNIVLYACISWFLGENYIYCGEPGEIPGYCIVLILCIVMFFCFNKCLSIYTVNLVLLPAQ